MSRDAVVGVLELVLEQGRGRVGHVGPVRVVSMLDGERPPVLGQAGVRWGTHAREHADNVEAARRRWCNVAATGAFVCAASAEQREGR